MSPANDPAANDPARSPDSATRPLAETPSSGQATADDPTNRSATPTDATDPTGDLSPHASFDGGDLDCGNGLLLLIRRHIDPLEVGQRLEIRSREASVRTDLPAWCRLTNNPLVGQSSHGVETRFVVTKGARTTTKRVVPTIESQPAIEPQPMTEPRSAIEPKVAVAATTETPLSADRRATAPPPDLPAAVHMPAAVPLPALPVMGIGSWPRPRWLMQALAERLQGRLSEADFQATANDAVRLVVDHQQRAGVQVLTDGEQRRDNYASFVGGILDNCQLIPLTDLLPYVDDPDKFAAELQALDIPASEVRHPAVFGPLGRSRPLAVHEHRFVAGLSNLPCKVALPGPYLLTRTMWLECVSDRAYTCRNALARDVVRVLREELVELLQAGVALVQFDEPVLTEVVFGQPSEKRSFMCGALSERLPPAEELAFALRLFQELTADLPQERIALHVCRGNWTPDESKALSGSYQPLLEFLCQVPVGNYFLEACTPRAGEWDMLADLPRDRRLGLGMVNQKVSAVEDSAKIVARVEAALQRFGDRLMLTPDCGFATFADNPLSSAEVATAKLAALTHARAEILGHGR